MGIIEQLYFGSINPQTRYVKSRSATSRAMKILSENEEWLRKLLNEEERKLFDAYDEAWAKVLGDSCLDSFIVGFLFKK